MTEIKIDCEFVSDEIIKQHIRNEFNVFKINDDELKFASPLRGGGAESVLIALISSSGVALTALITGLIKLAISKRAQKIVIQGKNGEKIEVPANTSEEVIDKYIKKAREFSIDKIILHG